MLSDLFSQIILSCVGCAKDGSAGGSDAALGVQIVNYEIGRAGTSTPRIRSKLQSLPHRGVQVAGQVHEVV